jgi:tetratricopeptide (TPR) repeat protein
MVAVTIADRADCLLDLGRLDESAAAYEESIELGRARGDTRVVAVGKGQLGSVRMLQRKYDEALAAYTEAREAFETLGEPGTVASAWHQIGMVHRRAGQYEAAERAYQESLKIEVQFGNRPGEAHTLLELGNLYVAMDRREEAVRFYRQAAALFVDSDDLAMEGRVRNNIADSLIALQRYAEARQELLRAIECKKPFGHAATPWTTFKILSDLERAVGNPAAAEEARRRAVQAYLDYRRDGGENLSGGGRIFAMVAQVIRAGSIDAAAAELAQWLQRPDLPDSLRALIPALQAVLSGERAAALSDDPNLTYDDAAELRLLLESLGPPAAAATRGVDGVRDPRASSGTLALAEMVTPRRMIFAPEGRCRVAWGASPRDTPTA